MGASGLGALIAALVLASRKQVFGLGRWVGIACGTFGVCLILFSFSRSFWLSALILVPIGFSMMTQMASSNTLVQAMIPDELRGRVMSVYSMMFMGMAPFGSLLSGSIAGAIGAPQTVAIGGAVCIAASALFLYLLPRAEAEGREMIVSMQMTGGEPASKASFQLPPDKETAAASA
jgi:MFS family permease